MADFGASPFTTNGYDVISLSMAITRLPYNMYGRVTQLGLFSEEYVATTSVMIEEQSGVLNLIPTTPRGAPAIQNQISKRRAERFNIPRVALTDTVYADDVQGVRAFGSLTEVDTLAAATARKQMTMKNKHAITLEWQRVGALKGVLLDADGTTVIYNWFNEFGFTPKVSTFTFSNPAFDFAGALMTVKREMEDALHGEVMTGVRALVSPSFFDGMMNNTQVINARQFFYSVQPPGYDFRKGFQFEGITFEEYRGTATDASGNAHAFIPSGTAQFFPEGTQSTFKTIYGPADYWESVNTIALPMYSKSYVDVKYQRFMEIETQMNPLNICVRPELLVQGNIA